MWKLIRSMAELFEIPSSLPKKISRKRGNIKILKDASYKQNKITSLKKTSLEIDMTNISKYVVNWLNKSDGKK